jgi:hypothetical protein
MLTGKYMEIPAAMDDMLNRDRAMDSLRSGRMIQGVGAEHLYRYRTAQEAIQVYKIANGYKMPLVELDGAGNGLSYHHASWAFLPWITWSKV